MQPFRLATAALIAALSAPIVSTAAQQTDFSISPFMSFPRTTGAGRSAGLALAFSGGRDFAFRIGAQSALKNTFAGVGGVATVIPPWGAEADAIFPLTGHPFGSAASRTAATYMLLGFGAAGADSLDVRLNAKNWSYGLGTTIPLGSVVDFLAESRWRMTRFVLPTASPKPAKTKELRFGLTFHVAGSNYGTDRRRPR